MSNQYKTTVQSHGYTLLEMMISQLLSISLIGSMLSLIAPNLLTLGHSNVVSMQQESNRFAMELMRNEIRQAGYQGCRDDIPTTSVINATSATVSPQLRQWAYNQFKILGVGANNLDKSSQLFGDRWNNRRFQFEGNTIGDILLLRGVVEGEFIVASHDPHLESIAFRGDITDQLKQSRLLEINDCQQSSTIHIGNNDSIQYDSARNITRVWYGAPTSNNCTAIEITEEHEHVDSGAVLLGGDENAHCSDVEGRSHFQDYLFSPGTRSHLLRPVVYYVGQDQIDGQPALYRLVVSSNGTASYSEAIVEGVENIRLLFGVDTTENGKPNQYITAEAIENGNSSWHQVVSLQFWLMIRTLPKRSGTTITQEVRFPDHSGNLVHCNSESEASNLACPFSLTPAESGIHVARRVSTMEIALRNAGI